MRYSYRRTRRVSRRYIQRVAGYTSRQAKITSTAEAGITIAANGLTAVPLLVSGETVDKEVEGDFNTVPAQCYPGDRITGINLDFWLVGTANKVVFWALVKNVDQDLTAASSWLNSDDTQPAREVRKNVIAFGGVS